MPLLTLIPLAGFILAWQRRMQASAATAALQATSAILLALYVASLTGMLHAVTWLLLIAGALFAGVEVFRRLRARDALPVPVGVLLILGVLFWFVHKGGGFAYYDEYAHWGIYIKEMLATDRLWGAETNAMHLRYLPGPPLWQYLFLAAGGPLEGGAFLAQFCLLLIPLLVLWERLTWRQAPWIIGIFALVALALSNFGHGFASLYVDHVLGAWFAGTLFCCLLDLDQQSPRRLLWYALPITTLVLLKDAGLYFAAAALGIMAVLVLWKTGFAGGRRHARQGFRDSFVFGLAGAVAIVLIAASWNLNRNALDIPAATISAGGILSGIVAGESSLSAADQAELSRRFRDVLLDQQVSKNETTAMYNAYTYGLKSQFSEHFRLTTASAIVLFAAWQIVVLTRLVKREMRGRWAILGAGLLLSLLLYLLILSLSYRFAFDERALSLSSYLRYVHTALLPMLLFVFLPLLPAGRGNHDESLGLPGGTTLPAGATIFTLLLAALYIVETPYLKPLYTAHEAPPIHGQLAPLTDRLRETVGDDRLWVYFPIPDANGLVGRIIRYQMTPVRTTVEVDPSFLDNGPEIISELLNEYDYLWFPIPSPDLDQRLTYYFGEDLKQRLFHVGHEGDGITVEAMDGVFR